MLFRTVASVAVLATSASAAANPEPYRLAMMPVLGMSLSRRDTSGYIPEETYCGDGETCSEACGQGYTECPSNDDSIHCYNPEMAQTCCGTGNGNSCEEGYYCTQDSAEETWCCPDSMNLSECAAAYSITGKLETPEPTPEPTTSEEEEPTSAPPSTSAPEPTSSVVESVSEESSSSTPASTTVHVTPTSSHVASSSVPVTSATWSGSNSTSSHPVVTVSSTVVVDPSPTDDESEEPEPTGAASVAGVSLSLLFAAAGFAALL